jgi:hypothetical protein
MAGNGLPPDVQEQIRQARQAEVEAAKLEPRAKSARYDADQNKIVLTLTNGFDIAIPVDHIEGLQSALPSTLAKIDVSPSGSSLRWEMLDVDLSVPQLAEGVYGTRAWMAQLGRRGGRASSAVKAAAARKNGRRGGRPRNTDPSPARLWFCLNRSGLDREFVIDRLISRELANRWDKTDLEPDQAQSLSLETATEVGRVFGWEPTDLFGTTPPTMNRQPGAIGWFKIPRRATERRLSAYVVYAHYLSRLVLRATEHLVPQAIPTDYREVHGSISRRDGMTFENALRFVWSLGVPVLPLYDRGAFYGACWRAAGRSVIVLKQSNLQPARWLADLLHETFHAASYPEQEEFSVIEAPEASAERLDSPEEQEANWFAWNVIFRGQQEELAEKCVEDAQGNLERLKSSVRRVAERAGLPTDYLALYLAYRLSLQGENWWGAATNLQEININPLAIARDVFLEHVSLERLHDRDRALLLRAIER